MDRESINRLFDLTGRTAIVTGGSRGIGRAIADGLAAAGANVVIASRKLPACEAAAGEITEAGGSALAVAAHLGDVDQLEALADATVERFGGIDILVNNAANALAQPIGQITPEAWDKAHAVNVRGPLFLFQAALPHLLASSHASVINVVSAGIYTPAPYLSIYISAKSALMSLTRSMAAEFVTQGIRVNALAPGTVDTDMVRNNAPEVQELMVAASGMKRIAAPDEMVGAALFLASDASSYMTGQSLVVDGGMTSH